MNNQKILIPKAELKQLYFNKRLSYSVIATRYRCHAQTICNRMKEFGFKARSTSEALKGREITWGEKIGKALKGRRIPEEVRLRMSEAMKGRKAHNKGKRGHHSASWKGGYNTSGDGYKRVYMPEHPNASKGGYVKEHRLVMEAYLDRLLRQDEHVHHLNLDRQDNRIENLLLASQGQHSAIHKYLRNLGLREFLESYNLWEVWTEFAARRVKELCQKVR